MLTNGDLYHNLDFISAEIHISTAEFEVAIEIEDRLDKMAGNRYAINWRYANRGGVQIRVRNREKEKLHKMDCIKHTVVTKKIKQFYKNAYFVWIPVREKSTFNNYGV